MIYCNLCVIICVCVLPTQRIAFEDNKVKEIMSQLNQNGQFLFSIFFILQNLL